MLLRAIRYCSTFQDYLNEREELRMALLLNKYPNKFIDHNYADYRQRVIDSPIKEKAPVNYEKTIFVHFTYCSSMRTFPRKFYALWNKDNIYSWKPLHKEIYPAIVYQWFEWPIKTSVINFQLKFADSYSWALSHDKMCSLSNRRNIIINDINSDEQMNLLSKCTCHKSSLYRPNEPWVLQQALIYTYGMFIDKSITVNHWTTELDPMCSTLSTSKRNKMIHYAIYYCFATTCFIRSALPSSSRANNNSANTNINQRIIKNINDDIELISDDDKITVNQCIRITINNDMLYEEISNGDNELNKALPLNNNESLYDSISDDDNEPNSALPPNDNDLCVSNHDVVDDVSDYEQEQQSLTKKRQLHSRTLSAETRKRRNRKRNLDFRMQRYRYFITRPFYYRFTMKLVRHILAEYKIYYTHVKRVDDLLLIGVKDKIIEQQNERRLLGDIFDRRHYYLFRRQAQYLSRRSHDIQE
ncbi:unnamed protein product [Rotaria sordida]|uniref:Helix-turn-helix domain-containing protein n=1 Tax=Rotaria sordida TaxID=392033 RepID=A0A819MYB4_9BILA|nr:unnamed protein product [Rotaria sordida]